MVRPILISNKIWRTFELEKQQFLAGELLHLLGMCFYKVVEIVHGSTVIGMFPIKYDNIGGEIKNFWPSKFLTGNH